MEIVSAVIFGIDIAGYDADVAGRSAALTTRDIADPRFRAFFIAFEIRCAADRDSNVAADVAIGVAAITDERVTIAAGTQRKIGKS